MMQFLGVILVLGMVVSGVEAAQVKSWGDTVAFLLFGVVTAAIFTFLWTDATNDMARLLGRKQKRSDITEKSVVSISVGLLALFTCVGFVTAGLAATMAPDYGWAKWFYGLGAVSTAILCWIWTSAEIRFVSNLKENSK
jgi:hypothetical protein